MVTGAKTQRSFTKTIMQSIAMNALNSQLYLFLSLVGFLFQPSLGFSCTASFRRAVRTPADLGRNHMCGLASFHSICRSKSVHTMLGTSMSDSKSEQKKTSKKVIVIGAGVGGCEYAHINPKCDRCCLRLHSRLKKSIAACILKVI